MATGQWSDLVAEEVDEMMALTKEYLKYYIEELWPSLVELKKPAERLDWYRQIDWTALRKTSEIFWQLMSADAKRLMQNEENQMASAIQSYEENAFMQAHAFRAEQQPLGIQPSKAEMQSFDIGNNQPLPLGQFGG